MVNKRRPPGSKRAIERVDYQKSRTIQWNGHRDDRRSSGTGGDIEERGREGDEIGDYAEKRVVRRFVISVFTEAILCMMRLYDTSVSRVRRTCFGTRSNRFREDSAITIYANSLYSPPSSADGEYEWNDNLLTICTIARKIFRGGSPRYFTGSIRELKLQPNLNHMTNLYFLTAK